MIPVRFKIVWTIKKMKSLLSIEDKAKHLSCVIYEFKFYLEFK